MSWKITWSFVSQNTPTTGAKNTIVGAPSQKTPATGQKNTDQHNRLEIPWLLSQKTPVPGKSIYKWMIPRGTQVWNVPSGKWLLEHVPHDY